MPNFTCLLPVILQLLLIIQMLKKLVHINHDIPRSKKKPDHKYYVVFVQTFPVLHSELHVKEMYLCHNVDDVLTWKLKSTVLVWPLVG